MKNYKFSGSYVLYTFNEDIEHVFVMTKDKHSMAYTDTYYYKDDVDLPEFDIKNIEFNGFGSIEFMDDEDSINTTYDRELIDTYLANIMSGDQIHRLNAELADTGRLNAELAGTNYHLVLLSTEYPGIGIDQSVYACRGKFWVTFKGSILIEMPQDILEKIAGRQLPTASEIEEQREEE
ncbi:hypothetical protein SDC9_166051 [bioreactor metagenome]|uniref:Uncharacterized protein n=1 Tax=bioreactor metagenome TaxID=1076179 RepID=A0A645FVY9_9ZZZZ